MTPRKLPLWQIVSLWTAANALGIAAAMPLSSLTSLLGPLSGLVGGTLLIGLPTGLAQWLALRRIAPVSPLWILTVFTGMLATLWLSSFIVLGDDESILALSAVYALAGLLIGLAQWLFLFKRFRRSFWYPLSSALGLGLALWIVLVTGIADWNGSFALALGILIYSLATALALAWMPPAAPASPPLQPESPA